MDIIKIHKLHLKRGEKVKVTFRNKYAKKEYQNYAYTLFFYGYRNLFGASCVETLYEVLPVFTLPNKNGNYSNKQFEAWSTLPDNIVSIEKVTDK